MAGKGMHGAGALHADLVPTEDEARALLVALSQKMDRADVVPAFIRQHTRAGATLGADAIDVVGSLFAEVCAQDGASSVASRCVSPALDGEGGERCVRNVPRAGGACSDGDGGGGGSCAARCTGEQVRARCGFTIEEDSDGAPRAAPDDVQRFLRGQNLQQGNMRNAFCEAKSREQLGASHDNMQQVVQRFTFVMAMDPGRGATPELLHKLLYCLKMMDQRHGGANKAKPKRGSGGAPSVDNIDRAVPNEARCEVSYGHSMHKVLLDENVVTVPLLETRVYIDAASTGGENPLLRCYLFVQVSCPLTFDFMANINYSCSCKGGVRDAAVSEELSRFWVEIASHQAAFGGGWQASDGVHGGLSLRFCDIFDSDGGHWLPHTTTAAFCVRAARQNMRLFALAELQRRLECDQKALPSFVVRFATLDDVSDDGQVPETHDAVWACLADRCVRAWHQQLAEFRAAERRFRTQQEGQKDGSFEGDGPRDEPPCFDPPPVPDLPTRIDWDDEALALALTQLACRPQRNSVSELLDIVEAHRNGLSFQGFPATWLSLQVLPDPTRPHAHTRS